MGDAKRRGSFKDRQQLAIIHNAVMGMIDLEHIAKMTIPDVLKNYYARRKVSDLEAIAKAKTHGFEAEVVTQFNQLKGKNDGGNN